MATPQPASVSVALDESSSRLIWVLSRGDKAYKGTHQGVEVTIPPRMQKVPKRYTEGGNLFPFMDGHAFRTSLKEPQEWKMDNAGKPFPVFSDKPLFCEELTPEEYAEFVGRTPTQIKKEIASEEKMAKKKLNEELNKRPNKVAVLEDEDE